MLPRLARLFMAFVCFPLLGAYGLRWAGGYVRDLIGLAGPTAGLPGFLDLIGAALGLLFGLLLAIQITGCAFQPDESPVRGPADTILIILGLTLLATVVVTRVMPDSVAVTWLPVATLVIWTACAAATMSLSHLRRDLRRQIAAPPYAADRTDQPMPRH